MEKPLHRIEIATLKALSETPKSIEEISRLAGLKVDAVRKAVELLREKGLALVKRRVERFYELGPEGEKALSMGLPERRLLETLESLGGKSPLSALFEKAPLAPEERNPALGKAKFKGWISVKREGATPVVLLIKKPEAYPEEELLRLLSKGVKEKDLPRELLPYLEELKKRPNYLKILEEEREEVSITKLGKEMLRKLPEIRKEISQLTPDLLVTGKWREYSFSRYDILAPVERVYPGKPHPYTAFLEEVREKLLALGFEEADGPVVEFAFFNCDALFMPQDHPAREIHDIYYVKNPQRGDLSAYSEIVERVKEEHEKGSFSGSKGWKYRFSVEEASKLVLRSQGTSISARLLARGIKPPVKYFAIARCYRPDVVDREHLVEFNQVEGIVAEENLNFRHLLGILDMFAREIAGAERVKFLPAYFPFTEPSVELMAYREGVGWMEFGGAGIFRPEVTRPLGVDVPVLAWGLGIDRLFMLRYGIDDIRYVFSSDLQWIREARVV